MSKFILLQSSIRKGKKLGLSSSQARLLNLTARMHDIEYKAQNLEAQKLQMANESSHVYQEYENALNKTKVQFKNISADGSGKYEDTDIPTLLEKGYRVKIYNGSTWVTAQGNTTEIGLGTFSDTIKDVPYTGASVYKVGDIVQVNGINYKLTKKYEYHVDSTITGYKEKTLSLTGKATLNNLVEAGFIIFEKPDTTSKTGFAEVNIATDTNLQEVSDETELKKAEAKYEADMRKIDAKDKKFDTDLAAMESERNAIKTEMDTLKSVAKDNVDRTFKLFS
mgnify:FL=1